MRTTKRLLFFKRVDAFEPHATIEKGQGGTIARVVDDPTCGPTTWIKLDRYHPGLADWENEVWFNDYTVPLDECAVPIEGRLWSTKALGITAIAAGIGVVLLKMSACALADLCVSTVPYIQHISY